MEARMAGLGRCIAGGRWSYLMLVALVTCFWWPALGKGLLILHGDSAHHGLMLLQLHGQALMGHDSLLWTHRIWGGHPHFAESQGGFANPLDILIALMFEPVRGWGILHWLDMLVGGAGVICLCRVLGISCWSATFAGIAVLFSGSWMRHQDDLPAFNTLAWLPWLIAAVEYWIKQPTILSRSSLVAVAAALMVVAGYPQITYGAVLYALASLFVQVFSGRRRVFDFRHMRPLLLGGLCSVALAVGLSAIQLFPLIELVGQSSRSDGIALFAANTIPPLYPLRGLLYFYFGGSQNGLNDPSLSNMVVLMLAGLLLFIRVPARIYGHLLGALLLLNLAMGAASPIFIFLYEYRWLPGLHSFRTTFAYYPVAVIGIAVVAAFILDVLSKGTAAALRGGFQRHRMVLLLVAGVYMAVWGYLVYYSYAPVYSKKGFLAMALAVLVLPWLFRANRQWVPLATILILIVDVVALRIGVFEFHDRKVLEAPSMIRAIVADPDIQDFRTMDESFGGLVAFLPPKDLGIEAGYRRLLKGLSPFPMALQWKVPTIYGVSALPLFRNSLVKPAIKGEVLRGEGPPPGLRLLDILGIRYISRNEPLNASGLALFAKDDEQGVFIYRNDYAKPRFQVYWNMKIVGTPEQALAELKTIQSETLLIEGREDARVPQAKVAGGFPAVKPAIVVVRAEEMEYRLNVDMPQEGWLFLADAYYPGWESTVNGARRPVYAAQVLGKAVRLDAGRNEVTIRYVPRMFCIGAAVSAITLLFVIFIFWRGRCQRQHQAMPEC